MVHECSSDASDPRRRRRRSRTGFSGAAVLACLDRTGFAIRKSENRPGGLLAEAQRQPEPIALPARRAPVDEKCHVLTEVDRRLRERHGVLVDPCGFVAVAAVGGAPAGVRVRSSSGRISVTTGEPIRSFSLHSEQTMRVSWDGWRSTSSSPQSSDRRLRSSRVCRGRRRYADADAPQCDSTSRDRRCCLSRRVVDRCSAVNSSRACAS